MMILMPSTLTPVAPGDWTVRLAFSSDVVQVDKVICSNICISAKSVVQEIGSLFLKARQDKHATSHSAGNMRGESGPDGWP